MILLMLVNMSMVLLPPRRLPKSFDLLIKNQSIDIWSWFGCVGEAYSDLDGRKIIHGSAARE